MAWSRDGETIVFSRYGAGIYEVPDARGIAERCCGRKTMPTTVMLFDTPQGRAVVFASHGRRRTMWSCERPAGDRRVLAHLDTNWPELVYSPSGHILYRQNPVDSPSIWALPFSATSLTVQGKPFLVERSGQGMSLSSGRHARLPGHRPDPESAARVARSRREGSRAVQSRTWKHPRTLTLA